MGWQDLLGGVLNQYATGAAPAQEDAHAHFDQIASAVPSDMLGSVIGPALGSLATPDVMQQVLSSATQMNPDQRGSLMGSLLSGLTSQGGDTTSLLNQLGINSAVAKDPSSATPEEIAALAAHAHENEPGVFNSAMSFYAQHPTLVKAFGALAVGAIVSHLANKR